MMSRDCFEKYGRIDLADRYDDLIKKGMSDKEAGRQIVLDEHKKLFDQLNDFKKGIGLKKADYKSEDISQKIKSINETHDKLVDEQGKIKEQQDKENVIKEQEKIKKQEEDKKEKQKQSDIKELQGSYDRLSEGLNPEQIKNDEGLQRIKNRIDELSGVKKTDEGDKNTVGIRHESLEKLSDKLGLGQQQRGTFLSPEKQTERGRQLLSAGADPQAISDEFHRTGKISADDISVVRAHLENLVRAEQTAATKFGNDSIERKEAAEKVNQWKNEVAKEMGTAAGGAFSALQGEADLDTGSFVAMERAVKEINGDKELTPTQSKEIKELSGQVAKLSVEVEGLKNKLTETIDKNAGEGKRTKNIKSTAKEIADIIRKGKLSRPDSFSSATPASLVWDGAIEVAAKTVEGIGTIAQGVSDGIAHIRNSEWYKGLAGDQKKQAEDDFTNYIESKAVDQHELKRIKQLETKLDNIRQGIVKEVSEKHTPSEREKELQEEIFEAKKNLGLVRPKEMPEKPVSKTPEETRIDRLEKELDNVRQGIVRGKVQTSEDTPRIKELKEQIYEARKNLGLTPSKELSDVDKQEIAELDRETMAKQFVNKKDNKFSPEDVKDIWDYAKENYIDKGSIFNDMLKGVGTDLGLSAEQIQNAITQPKGAREVSIAMYKKQYERNKAIARAKDYVKSSQDGASLKFIKTLPSKFFNLATFGHGTVGFLTHAGPNIFRPGVWNSYWPNFFKQFRFAYGNVGKYEMAMDNLRNSKNFDTWNRSGLAVDPKTSYDQWQIFGKNLSYIGETGTRGFNALKVLRYDMAESFYNSASQTEKADPNLREEIAKLVNHATGVTEVKIPKVISTLSFAPGLEVSRWQRMVSDPIKAGKTYASWWRSTPSERAAAKIVASGAGQRLATYSALLAANAGLLTLAGSKQKINYDDPSKSDWLKFKAGDKTIDFTSGVLNPIRLLKQLGGEAVLSVTGTRKELRTKPQDKDAQTIFQQLRYKASPIASFVDEGVFGSDAMGNPTPWSNIPPDRIHHKLDFWTEYVPSHAPIPVAAGVKAAVDGMRERGMSQYQINDFWNGILQTFVEGGTGVKMSDDYSLKENK